MALFVNNTTAFPPTRDIVGSGGGGKVKDGSPGPSAVNSLAWSSVEERLFTGDTDGLVKVSTGRIQERSVPTSERRVDRIKQIKPGNINYRYVLDICLLRFSRCGAAEISLRGKENNSRYITRLYPEQKKVWDVKGAITCWGSARDGGSHSSATNGASLAAASDNDNSSRGSHGKTRISRNANGRGWKTRATTKNNNNNDHGSSNTILTKTIGEVDAGTTTACDQRFNRTGSPTTESHPSPIKTSTVSAASGAPVTPPEATKFSASSSTFDATPASRSDGEREEAKGGVRENESVCRRSSDGKGGGREAVAPPSASGDGSSATLWPTESGGPSQGGAFADRYGFYRRFIAFR